MSEFQTVTEDELESIEGGYKNLLEIITFDESKLKDAFAL